jgi:NAD-dependent dihydropyrimidine dehydrogenase PreA subunit/flavodoxin
MKVILYVFSGTGNTLKVASLYKKYLNAEVDICRISKKTTNIPSADEYDLIGIGYPIHAFCAPEPIVNFVKTLPSVAYRRAFIFKSSGEGLHVNDGSSRKLLKILAKKGYNVVGERHIVMPYNMIYRHTDEMAKQMWIYAQALVMLHSNELNSFKSEKVRLSPALTFCAPLIGIIEQKFAHIHGPMFKVDTKKCIQCGKCISACPQNNITLTNGKFKFGSNCVLCMGCSFGCPKNAIKVGVFKFWKVNGSYNVEKLAADKSIPFPLVPDRAKGVYKLYKKYYREADKMLADGGIDINCFL